MRTRLANLPPEKRKRILEKYSAKKNPSKSAATAEKKIDKPNINRTETGKNRRRVVSARKNSIIVALCLISLALVFAVTYGFYAARIAGWELSVSIQSFSFSLNGKECDNQTAITPETLNLAKGREADFVLAVEAKGYANNTFCVPYQLNIDFLGGDNTLARAIEVYEFSDGEYVYVSMLDEFIGDGWQHGEIIRNENGGLESQDESVFTGINGATYYRYKFVYSEAAGDFYENTTFSLVINAKHGDPVYENNCYYIYTAADMETAETYINTYKNPTTNLPENPCLTLVLLNDITLDRDISISHKTGIDLHGYTLNTGNYKISITDNDVAGNNTVYEKGTNGYNLSFENSELTGGITGTGTALEYISDKDIMLVYGTLANNASVVTTTSNTTKRNTALASHFSDNLAKICETPLTWSGNTADADISSGLKNYLSLLTGFDDAGKMTFANGVMTFTETESKDITTKDYVQFTIGNSALTFGGYVTIRGNSPELIALYYTGKIPALISSSIFLPTYDAASGATLTWVSDNTDIITSDGVFLPAGFQMLPDWTNQNISLGVIVGIGDNKYTKFILREVEILSAEERTRIIYAYPELVLGGVEGVDGTTGVDGFVSSIDVEDGMTGVISVPDPATGNQTTLTGAEVRERLGYIVAEIEVSANPATDKNIATNINYTGDDDAPFYVEYHDNLSDTDGYDINGIHKEIECAVKPESLGALVVPSKVTLYFDKSATDNTDTFLSFEISRDILVVGKSAIETLNDATATLQPAFDINSYTSTALSDYDFSFLADGSYDNGKVLVDYSLTTPGDPANPDSWCNKIEIVNGIHIEDENGLFVRNADGTFRIRTDSEIAGTTFYSRKSLIIIKPENVGMETETCPITAKLISNTATGESVEYENSAYLDASGTSYIESWTAEAPKEFVEEDGEDITYNLSLVVEGLYHNRATEIADSNLWLALLDYYDTNSDGYISVSEAKNENITASSVAAMTSTGETPYNYNVLNLSGKGITSVKGIEYFENVTGLNFDSLGSISYNSIINIEYLSNLYKLEYLSMQNNGVTDISSLQYLDSLEYIDISNNSALTGINTNSITDITPIKYLPNVRYLDLDNNAGVNDVSALENYTELRCLNLVGCSATSLDNMYYLTLIFNGCSDNFTSGSYGIYNTAGNAYIPDSDLQNAALALKNLDVIDETFNTINFKTISVNGSSYHFRFVSAVPGVLEFYSYYDKDNNVLLNSTTSNWNNSHYWKITTPNVDTNVNVSVYVTTDADASQRDDYSWTITRSFDINVLQLCGHANMTYIVDADGKVRVASELVPDSKLRELLFLGYNNTTAGNVYIVPAADGEGFEIGASGDTGAIEVSENNIITRTEIANAMKIRDDWNNKGITDLSGIEAFSDGITSLNLKGNIINNADISPLAKLENLTTLYLDGQKYDFTQLSAFSEETDITTDYTKGDIYSGSGIFGTGMTSLQYLSVFGCYGLDDADTLAALYQVYLMNPGVYIYKDVAFTGTFASTDKYWSPYELPLARYFCTLPTEFSYCELTTGANDYHTNVLYVDENGALRVNARYNENDGYYYEFNFYGVRTVSFKISYSGTKASGNCSGSLKTVRTGGAEFTTGITGFKYGTLVGYTDTAYIILSLSGENDINFDNKNNDNTINTACRNETVSGSYFTEHNIDFNYHIKVKTSADAPAKALSELFPGRSLIATIMKQYTVTGGVHQLGITDKLTGVSDSAGNIVFTLGTNDKIDIGNSLEVTGLFLTGGESSIQGVQYTSVTTLTIDREAILGDGTWLANIVNLYIGYSAVDLSTIKYSLPNLKSFNVGKYGNENDKRECWTVNMYDAGEYNISDTSSDIYRYIVGLNPVGSNYTAITGGTKNPESGDYSGASLQREAYLGGGEDAALYTELRKIARSTDANGHYYFYLNYMPNLETLFIRDTDVFDWTGLLALMFKSDTVPTVGTADYYSQYYDKNKLSAVEIFGTAYNNNNYRTRNSNGGIAEPIIRKLYYASTSYVEATPNTYTVNEGAADEKTYVCLTGTPTYKIGTFTDNLSSVEYHPTTFAKKAGSTYTLITGWHNQQYTHWEDGGYNYNNYFSTNLNTGEQERNKRVAAAEAAEFKNYILDYDVRLGSTAAGAQHFLSQEQTVASGGTVYLPTTTQNASFGSNTPEEFKRDFSIVWTRLDGTAIPQSISNGYNAVSLNPTHDTYVVFVGVCNGITKYYPVLFLGSTAYTPTNFGTYTASYAYSATNVSYRSFPDLQTRLFVYISNGMSATLNPTSVTSLAYSAADSAKYAGMTSLDGFEIFTALESINIQNNTISDISALGSLTSLESINLKNNLTSDISSLAGCSALTALDLSDNSLCKTYDGTRTYFPSSCTTLDISNNEGVVAADIEKMTTLTQLTTLTMFGTGASNDMAAVYAIRDILAAQTNGSIALRFSSNTPFTATTATIAGNSDSIVNILDGITGDANYQSLVNPLGGRYYTFNTGNAWNSSAFGAVTVTILNPSVYNSGFSTIKGGTATDYIVGYISRFSVLAEYNGFSIVKTVIKSDTTSLAYDLIVGGVTIPYSSFDPEIYAYILYNFGGTINTTARTITVTEPTEKKIIFTGTQGAGIKSLKGLDKISYLDEISITGSATLPVVLSELGFTVDNSSIKTFTLGEHVVISETGMSSLGRLTGLTKLDLSKCHGINYTNTVGGTNVASIIAGMTSLTNIKINNEINYLGLTSQVGADADKKYVYAAGSLTFGGKALNAYTASIDLVSAYKFNGTQIKLLQRCDNSKALSTYYYWQGDAYAEKSESANAIKYNVSNAAIEKFTEWTDILSYLSDMTVSGARKKLPGHIYAADFTGADPEAPERLITEDTGKFTLPKTFSFLGDSYTVTWNISVKNNNAAVTRNNIFNSSGDYATLIFGKEMFEGENPYIDGDIITLTGTFTAGGKTQTLNYPISVTVDAPPTYYQPTTAQTLITNFYLELEDGEIVSASQFFDSYRLLYWLYNISGKFTGGELKNASGNNVLPKTISAGKGLAADGTYVGKYLTLKASEYYFTYADMMSVTKISIQYDASKEDGGIGIASIKGIELFKNLKEFSQRQGYITSIEPLKNLKLTKFWYNNSDTTLSNTIIQDWTPLYNSRDTLTEFTYMYRNVTEDMSSSSVYPDDFSFLLGFGNLTSVNIGKYDKNGTAQTVVLDENSSINRLSAFKYMIARYAISRSNITFAYKNASLYSNNIISAAANIDSDMLGAAQILSEFNALDAAGFDYKNGYELFFRGGFGNGSTTSAVLPGYIDHGGVLYPIEWQTMSAFAKIDYVDSSYTDTITGHEVSVTDEAEYFTQAALSNKWVLTVSDRTDNYISNIHIVARVLVGETIYERMFTINCADDNEYPSITFRDGYASYTLGTGTFSAYNGSTYYSITNENKTLVLNSTAVGRDVYVNVNGVKTRIYYNIDSTFFDAMTANSAPDYRNDLASDALVNIRNTYQTKAAARERLDHYLQIPIGKWLYIEYTYPTEVASMLNVINDLREWCALLEATPVSIVYNNSGTYTNTNPATWHISDGTVTLADAGKPGYYFVGWYTDSAYTNEITTLSEANMANRGGETVTLYARFFFINNSITYSLPTEVNGTAINPSDVMSNSNTKLKLDSANDSFVLADLTINSAYTSSYEFAGWYLDSAYTQPVTAIDIDTFGYGDAITVYAKIVIVSSPMTVEFNANVPAGSNASDITLPASISYRLSSGTVALTNATVGGTMATVYTFDGWYTQATGGTKVTEITSSDYVNGGTLTLYAQYAYTYIALTTKFQVGKYSARASFGEYTFYYRTDATGSVDKLQLNSDSDIRIVRFNTGSHSEAWFYDNGTALSSGIAPAVNIMNMTWRGTTETGLTTNYVSGTSYSTNTNGATYAAGAIKLGSYELTIGADNAVSFTYASVANVYTMSGTGGDDGLGTIASSYINEAYTFVYLYTTDLNEDIYALWLDKSAALKCTVSFNLIVVGSDSQSGTANIGYGNSNSASINVGGVAQIPLSGYGSYTGAKNGLFLVFCPQGGYTPKVYNGNNTYVDMIADSKTGVNILSFMTKVMAN